MVNESSRWSPVDYAKNAAFVPALGEPALRLLDPQPGELVLDLGCGDGVLTEKIAAAGARAIGFDSSPEMVEAARARGIDAFVVDAERLAAAGESRQFGEFDAVFSNAALHWMLDADAVARGAFSLLRPGGRFVGEMGGEGNIALLRGAIRAELTERGYPVPATDPQWFPSVEAFARVYAAAGFVEIAAERIERPTPLPAGIAEWVRTFRAGWLDQAAVPEAAREEIADAIERRLAGTLRRPDGSWFADYVRLRFSMRKPG